MHVRSDDGAKIKDPHRRFFLLGCSVEYLLLLSICMDNRKSEWLIYDSSEPHPMKLCKGSLMLFVGYYASYQGMTDLRNFVRHTSVERLGKKKKFPSVSGRTKRKSEADASSRK